MLSSQLEESLRDVDSTELPWDLHEAKGTGRPGINSPESIAALKKGYLDLGLADPSLVNEKVAENAATKIANMIMDKGEAFVRDPDGVFEKMFGAKLEKMVRDSISVFYGEMESEATESDDDKRASKYRELMKKAESAKVTATPVEGKTGKGYRIKTNPSVWPS